MLCGQSRCKSSGATSPWGLNEKSCTSYHQFFVRRRKASWPEGGKKVQPAVTFATLETRRGKESKCVPQLFVGWLLGTRRPAIGHTFFLSQQSLRRLNSTQFSFSISYLKKRIVVKSELKQRHFWETNTCQPEVLIFFPFNMPWRYTICIAWFLYACRDDLTENLGKTTAQECKKVHFRLSCVAQKRLCLNSLKWHQKSVIVLTGRKLGFNDRYGKGVLRFITSTGQHLLLASKIRNLDKTDTDSY